MQNLFESPALASIEQASAFLCISPKTARNWIVDGKFPVDTFKINGRRVCRQRDLYQLVENLGKQPETTSDKSHPVVDLPNPLKRSRGRPKKLQGGGQTKANQIEKQSAIKSNQLGGVQ